MKVQAWSAVVAALLTAIHYDIITGIIVFLCLSAISPTNTGM
jgi:hypothetical protein